MKKLFTLVLVATSFFTMNAKAQHSSDDKSKRKSPPAVATQKLNNGATITINYGQPSLKGRTIGVSVEPKENVMWRTGANEATVFETNKDIKVMGELVPAGKYSLFTIFQGQIATVILNKDITLWGTDGYDANKDQARFQTKVIENTEVSEKMTFNIAADGTISLLWGNKKVDFWIQ